MALTYGEGYIYTSGLRMACRIRRYHPISARLLKIPHHVVMSPTQGDGNHALDLRYVYIGIILGPCVVRAAIMRPVTGSFLLFRGTP